MFYCSVVKELGRLFVSSEAFFLTVVPDSSFRISPLKGKVNTFFDIFFCFINICKIIYNYWNCIFIGEFRSSGKLEAFSRFNKASESSFTMPPASPLSGLSSSLMFPAQLTRKLLQRCGNRFRNGADWQKLQIGIFFHS